MTRPTDPIFEPAERPAERRADHAGHGCDHTDDHDRGLVFDVQTLLARRRLLGMLGGLGASAALAACAADRTAGAGRTSTQSASSTSSTSSSAGATSSTTSAADAATTPAGEVPDETGGPYPADGSNGPNILDDSGIVRSDITTSFGTSTTRAAGVPLTVNLTVTDASHGYEAMEGAAVYLWHCTRDGQYSMYGQGLENENFLRGVQPANSSGTASFTTIFPGAYSGRWPHIHFEVYQSVADARSSGQIVKTSQIALPEAACREVYGTSGYEESVQNLARTSLTGDNVFGEDGGILQLATVTGNPTDGYIANLTIGVV